TATLRNRGGMPPRSALDRRNRSEALPFTSRRPDIARIPRLSAFNASHRPACSIVVAEPSGHYPAVCHDRCPGRLLPLNATRALCIASRSIVLAAKDGDPEVVSRARIFYQDRSGRPAFAPSIDLGEPSAA